MERNMSRLFSLIQFYSGLGLRHWEMLMSLSNMVLLLVFAQATQNFAVVQTESSF